MGYQIVLFLLIIITVIFWYSRHLYEGFNDPSIPGMKSIEEGQQKFNDFMTLVNIANPQITLSSESAKDVVQATVTPTYSGGLPGEFQQTGTTKPYQIPETQPESIRIAQEVCERVKSVDCSAFDDPSFAMNCGISMDTQGRNSKGEPHMGGLYLSDKDRDIQTQDARAMGTSEKKIRYRPTIGSAKKRLFSHNKASCIALREQYACQHQKVLGTGNCTQCYTSSDFNRIDPETPRIYPSLHILTNASSLSVNITGGVSRQLQVTRDVPLTVGDLQIKEGEQFTINATGNSADLYLCGYLAGQTTTGEFILDLSRLIQIDSITQQRPRLMGSRTVNGKSCSVMRPGMGKDTMNLSVAMPFTFLTVNEEDALSCSNGPFITQSASATMLESDPCFKKGSGPGTYGLPCLQQMFVSMGGTTGGTGYPSSTEKARAILYDTTGKARELADIGQYLYDMNVRAATGRDLSGRQLTIPEWNTASMFCTGIPIESPCDMAIRGTGPITDECLTYLYRNEGANTSVGATYSLGSQYASANGQYCLPEGRLNPTNAGAAATARSKGTVPAIKQFYDSVHKTANNNALTNEQRAEAIRDCYGDSLRQREAETYMVGPHYMYRKGDSQAVCAKYGARVATKADVEAAYRAGADWCFTGWVSDDENAMYPVNDSLVQGCALSPTVAVWTPPEKVAGVTCYGPKPARNQVTGNEILPFNWNKGVWNQVDSR